MMTSLGTCRFVMPLSELTIASWPLCVSSLDIWLDLSALACGKFA